MAFRMYLTLGANPYLEVPANISINSSPPRFMTGPPDLNDDKNMGKVPRVYVNTEEIDEECYLMVYTALSATICLLVNGESDLFPLLGAIHKCVLCLRELDI